MMADPTPAPTVLRPSAVMCAFLVYGLLWGPQMSLLPDVRHATGADEAHIGSALLVGACAALPAAMCVGYLLDRFGRPVALWAIVSFAVSAVLPVLAWSVSTLVLSMAIFGFASGACNVVVVALAAHAESQGAGPMMNRAYAMFPLGLLVSSASVAALRGAGLPAVPITAGLGVLAVTAVLSGRGRVPPVLMRRRSVRPVVPLARPVLVLCVVLALAELIVNGTQQWSALYLSDAAHAPVALAAAGPAVFAAAVVAGRAAGHKLSHRLGDRRLLIFSGILTGAGLVLLSAVDTPFAGLLLLAAVGVTVSVALPSAYSLVAGSAPAAHRGTVLGWAASIASLGVLVGPALVGQVGGVGGLRFSMVLLGAAALLLAGLASFVPIPYPTQSRSVR